MFPPLLITPPPLQPYATLIPHSGKEAGGEKSLRVAVGEFDARVSAMNVVKHGMLAPKIAFRSMPPSSSSPWANVVWPDLFRKPHGEVTPSAELTTAHKSLWPVVGSQSF